VEWEGTSPTLVPAATSTSRSSPTTTSSEPGSVIAAHSWLPPGIRLLATLPGAAAEPTSDQATRRRQSGHVADDTLARAG
jgi:hypothetical protein